MAKIGRGPEYHHSAFSVDDAWKALLHDVVVNGVQRPDRTGVGTKALYGTTLRVSCMREGLFPAVTTKKLFIGQVWGELAAFVRGYSTLEEFHSVDCSIWDANAKADYWLDRDADNEGKVGRIYGVQWREWRSGRRLPSGATYITYTDQLANLVEGIKQDPYGRRHLVSAWNPGELDLMCLPPCHVMFQCFVEPDQNPKLKQVTSMRVDMRSVDLFLGLPFDIASYATLLELICGATGTVAGDLIFHMGDSHVYLNHLEAVDTVLGRKAYDPPVLISGTVDLDFHPRELSLHGYKYHPAVKAPMNV